MGLNETEPGTVRLGEILAEVGARSETCALDVEVGGVQYDSRRVRPGDLFFGLKGLREDGQAFVLESLRAGAIAAVVGEDVAISGVPLARVEDPRRALAVAAAAFFGHPSRELRLVGVTGTNGKTTTTMMMQSIFAAAGIPAGLIGTTGYRLGEEIRPAPFTTPEAPELQSLLREMVTRGIRGAAVELSSHALEQRRCYGVECDVAIFTNLSREHLDYHGSLEKYLDAKLRLFDGRNRFEPAKATSAVINADDPVASEVTAAARRGGLETVTFGAAPGSSITIAAVAPGARGLSFELAEGNRTHRVSLALLGRFNAWNAAGAFAAARALGIDSSAAVRGLESLDGVPGRLERVDRGQPFQVTVDYAHTPDALAHALRALREHTRGRLLLVFGCGGDRDRGKRPLMGAVAAAESDRAWITNDNPRSEDPAAIAGEIAAGVSGGRFEIELDRRRAIAAALAEARGDDTVLIAGKGHETTQTIGGQVLPFDDREVARALLSARAWERR
jgi:UDP-N-acetylmuramoyl-L-alanyl-D-glutamate--2,6-diaminopimelate ligase